VRLRAWLVAAALLGSGCSAIEFAYSNAGAWVGWKADQYLDLRGDQERELDVRVAKFFTWHRAEALPAYARLADEAAARLERGAQREDMVWGYDALREQVRDGLRRAGLELGEFPLRLEPAQIAHLERELAEDNRRYARRYLEGTPEERRARRLARLQHTLEDWLGELSDAQRERIRRFNETAPLNAALRDRERRRHQAELLALLRGRTRGGALGDWAAHWDRGREPEFAAANRAQLEAFFDLLADLERMLSERQRAHVVDRLREYARDFRSLAAR
jgi:hypothetical protein